MTPIPTPPKWEYSEYSALLRLNGKPFALVTPDGKSPLSKEQQELLMADLQTVSDLENELLDARKLLAQSTFPPVIKLEDLEGVREALQAMLNEFYPAVGTSIYVGHQIDRASTRMAVAALATLNATNPKEKTK